MSINLIQPERISIKHEPGLSEKWLQEVISKNPEILGIGDQLVVKDKERRQPQGGRLDLLLQDTETYKRYEVEIQLGKTDESHIIRTIEYWDIERKRYPQYEHCAVIVAEEITSRFLNVISLFNGFIPIIALQVNAYKTGDNDYMLIFTKVLDEVELGLVEDEEETTEAADRSYWTERSSYDSVRIADEVFALIKSVDPSYELKYNKYYIGIAKDNQPNNFVVFRPKRNFTRVRFRMDKDQKVDELIDEEGIEFLDYSNRDRGYQIILRKGDVHRHKDLLTKLTMLAMGKDVELGSTEKSIGESI
ncbi:MAG: hypothetical protein GX763_08395 [Clostridiaceae bacterium]|nr:hypothetical protein [Clostridiaceae bacterium]